MPATPPRSDSSTSGRARSAGRLSRAAASGLLAAALGCGFGSGVARAQKQAASGALAKSAPESLRPARMHAVVSSQMLAMSNRNDYIAAIRAWFEIVGKEHGFLLDSKVEIVDSVASIRQRLQAGAIDIMILDFVSYMQLESNNLVRAKLLGKVGDRGPRFSHLLLVHPTAGIDSIADLRGKKISYYSRNADRFPMAWIDLQLSKQKLGRAGSYFAAVTRADKAQNCILPLFFRTIDACIVSENELQLQQEMNPQLGKLTVLARSVPVVESVIARPIQPVPYEDEIDDAILTLHRGERGKQLLMVFKTDRVVRPSPADIDATRAFWSEYRQFNGSFSVPEDDAVAATAAAGSGQPSRQQEAPPGR